MFLSSASLTSSWLPSAAPAATTPPLTIMRPALSVSSTIPGISASSSVSYKLTTKLWNSKAPAEAIVQEQLNPYYAEAERWYTDRPTEDLSSKCGGVWETSFYQWVSTAIEHGTLLDKFSCFNNAVAPGALVRSCWNISTEWAMLQTFETEAQSFPFTASPPCCRGCSFTAGDVQVYHWPPATTSPLVSMLSNSEGFTFTYPSVYVAFHTIVASDLCSLVGSAIPSITTLAFDASELSTAASYFAPLIGSWGIQEPAAFYITEYATWWSYSQMDLRTSVVCTDIITTVWTGGGAADALTSSPPPQTVSWTSSQWTSTLTWSKISTEYKFPASRYKTNASLNETTTLTYIVPGTTETITGTASTGTYTVNPYSSWALTYNPCEPYLSVPARILTLDPLWKTCSRAFKGLHDPPVLLEPSNGFFPVTTTPPGGPSGFLSVPTIAPESPAEDTLAASAGQLIPQPVVTKTPSPNISNLPTSKLPPVATIGTTTVTANSDGIFIIGTRTLAPGQQITESGTLLSMASDGRELIIGSNTQVLDPAYAIGTQALSAGGAAVTFDGTVMSLMSGSGTGGESVVIGHANGQSWTEDASMLTGIGTGTRLGTERATVSVGRGGSGAGKGESGSNSGSTRMKVGALIVCQIMLFCLAEFYVR
ncbi:hypothetical protein N431DRAFT_464019 [Stipitochalara longipes BDJ]|nr:hypothetical protein N431DRAFT_464019 [Stipitochalara longipes BDJ]